MRENVGNKETDDIVVELDEVETRYKTILPFYVYVAQCMGYTDSEVENYDCRKIWVAKNILDAIIEAYQKKCPVEYFRNPELVNQEIMMLLAISGPKTDYALDDNHVKVEPGFITLKKMEVGHVEDNAS